MNARIMKWALLTITFLLISLPSSGTAESSGTGMDHLLSLHKMGGMIHANSRKLLELRVVQDYDEPGANPKHDGSKGKRGGGGKTP